MALNVIKSIPSAVTLLLRRKSLTEWQVSGLITRTYYNYKKLQTISCNQIGVQYRKHQRLEGKQYKNAIFLYWQSNSHVINQTLYFSICQLFERDFEV